MARDHFTKLQATKHPLAVSRRERATRWIQKHQRQLRIGLGGVGALILCIAIFFLYRAQQHQYGLSELRNGLSALSKKDFPGAITHLEHAADSLPEDEGVRRLVLLYLGSTYRTQQQPKKAQVIYNEIAADSEKSEQQYLLQLALLQLGRTTEHQGQFSEAAQWYEKAKALNGPFKSEALFAHAEATQKAGNTEAARLYYKEFNNSYSDSPLAELAKERGE